MLAERSRLSTPEDTEGALSDALERHLGRLARDNKWRTPAESDLPPAELAAIRRAHDIVAGRPDDSLGFLASRHLSDIEADGVLRPSTAQAKRLHLGEFVDWFGRNRSWREVRRRDAQAFLRLLMTKAPSKGGGSARISPVTVTKILSAARVFFDWVLDHEDPDERPANPFDGVQPPRMVRGRESAHRPWTTDEVTTLLRGVPPTDPLWSLGAIAAYSGARLEEIASLRIDAVEGLSFVVREGKRQASVRRVPIHPVIAPLFERLRQTSPDGYVIPNLLMTGPDAKRGGLLGKRFGYVIRRLGISDRRVVFHALRNTVETQMVAAHDTPVSIALSISVGVDLCLS